jgi:intein/homing endonuclease
MHVYAVTAELAEEIGIHVGDGSMNIYNEMSCYTLACHAIDDREYMDKHVIPLYERLYSVKIKPRMWSHGAYGFRLYNRAVLEFKHEYLGLPLGSKNSIQIPTCIRSDEQLMKAFLRGFVSTDGSVNTFVANKKTFYPRIEMGNVSKQLILQIQAFLVSNGYRTSIYRINKDSLTWNDGLRVTLNGFAMLKKWREEIGFPNPKQDHKAQDLLKNKPF